jgi:hypothetical protein
MREGNAPAVSHADRLPSTIGGIARLAYAHAKAAGIASDPLLKKAGLTHHQIEDPRTVIRVRDQIKFLDLVAAAVDDDLFGFHLAQTPDLRQIGLLYYVLASSDTLIDALQRAARYSAINNEGISQRCIDGKSVGMSIERGMQNLPNSSARMSNSVPPLMTSHSRIASDSPPSSVLIATSTS